MLEARDKSVELSLVMETDPDAWEIKTVYYNSLKDQDDYISYEMAIGGYPARIVIFDGDWEGPLMDVYIDLMDARLEGNYGVSIKVRSSESLERVCSDDVLQIIESLTIVPAD
ncbi:MAG: hypothetical protein GXY52_01415 [Chloroflexi bacterium]|nr:hypothetical protein [Chloroflexota bacterium]